MSINRCLDALIGESHLWNLDDPISDLESRLDVETHGHGNIVPVESFTSSIQRLPNAPLLPISRPMTPLPISPTYVELIMDFIWVYILTESTRDYLTSHKAVAALFVLIVTMVAYVCMYHADTEALSDLLHFVLCYITSNCKF